MKKRKRFRTCVVSFKAAGAVRQLITITKKGLTPQQLLRMLRSGEARTTTQQDGDVFMDATGEEIGQVDTSCNELKHADFDLERFS
jgi:hypothetical protein